VAEVAERDEDESPADQPTVERATVS
jgi:hypothetical protein